MTRAISAVARYARLAGPQNKL